MASVYHLGETELSMIRSWAENVDNHYARHHAERLRKIAEKAIRTKALDEDELYELLKLLPLMIPQESKAIPEQESDATVEWLYPNDEESEKYQQRVKAFSTALTNLLFLQNAVYQKSLAPQDQPRSAFGKKPNENNQVQ